jgi:hypothetical protein
LQRVRPTSTIYIYVVYFWFLLEFMTLFWLEAHRFDGASVEERNGYERLQQDGPDFTTLYSVLVIVGDVQQVRPSYSSSLWSITNMVSFITISVVKDAEWQKVGVAASYLYLSDIQAMQTVSFWKRSTNGCGQFSKGRLGRCRTLCKCSDLAGVRVCSGYRDSARIVSLVSCPGRNHVLKPV